MLATRAQISNGARDVRVDGVFLSAGRGGMMRFVEDQQGAAAESAEPVAQGPGVRLVDQKAMGDKETRMRAPRIDAKAALAADLLHVVLVEDFKDQAETCFQLIL